MTVAVRNILVRKSIVVNAPQAHVFETFTKNIDTWWPRAHHIGGKEPFTAIMEPRVGGRWFERAGDGSECPWGRVLAWEPPKRVVLAWDINADWQYQEGFGTEVEVQFVSEGPERTRVTLEHGKLERFGDKAEAMRAMFEGEGAWGATLEAFAKAAAASAGR
jgi:uncharacterized protein YndB with AHSA1/START domain